MSDTAYSISEAVKLLRCCESTLKEIYLDSMHSDEELAELADCLLAHPDAVTHVYLSGNRLTDETGIKLSRYLAASSTIQYLNLYNNQFGEAIYLAIAAALRINISLRTLRLYNNQVVNKSRINEAFVNALILNPFRHSGSWWSLYLENECEFKRLKKTAEELGHPSMQALLTL